MALQLPPKQLVYEAYLETAHKQLRMAECQLYKDNIGNKTPYHIARACQVIALDLYGAYDPVLYQVAQEKLPCLERSAAKFAMRELAMDVEQRLHSYSRQIPTEKEPFENLHETMRLLTTLDDEPKLVYYAAQLCKHDDVSDLFHAAVNYTAKNRIDSVREKLAVHFNDQCFLEKPAELKDWDTRNKQAPGL